MSEYRQLHRSFWESPSVEVMDPVEKLMYCYLITAPLSNMEGLYRTTLRRIAFETGIDRDMCLQLLSRLQDKLLAGFRDGWVCVTQATKHMPKSPQMKAHAAALYATVPPEIRTWCESIGYVYGIALDNTILDKDKTNTSDGMHGKVKHPKHGVPINQAHYDRLCAIYGAAVVDDMIGQAVNWVASKGKQPYADYAAAADNWIKRAGIKPATQAVTVTCPDCGRPGLPDFEGLCKGCYEKRLKGG